MWIRLDLGSLRPQHLLGSREMQVLAEDCAWQFLEGEMA
jgi:hypothetical protein